jgi:serine/threonine protein kinase
MQELVFYYKTNGSLCCKLTDACPNAACKRSVTEIDRSSLVLLERIYGSDMDDMWYGTWACRVKKIPVQIRRLSPRLHSIADIVQETSVTRKLLHENVVQLFGVSTDKEPMYIISESLDNGSLLYYLREGAGQCITFREKIELAVQVARGIEYLHSQPCVHRFLCGKNIFLNDRNVPKIANFRYAKFLSGESSVLKLPVEDLHTRWSPPEVLESGLFSLKSDIWSFGILVTEIITNGRLPYSDVQCRAQLKRMVVSEHYRIPRARLIDCPVSLYEVLLSCWKSEPTKRPGFDFIITGLQDCIPLDKGCKSTLH